MFDGYRFGTVQILLFVFLALEEKEGGCTQREAGVNIE